MFSPAPPTTQAQKIALARLQRLLAKPGTVGAHLRAYFDADVRHYLDAVRCPTLIFHGRSSLPALSTPAFWPSTSLVRG
jgi:hypothetical protein